MTPSPLALAARTYARHAVPLTALAFAVFAPLIAFAFLSPPPTQFGPAWRMVIVGWVSVGTAWLAQYMLVGAAAPLARAIAGGAPLSQLAGVGAATHGLLRAVLPCLIVLGAVALGTLALVIPGLVLGVLFALTGASTRGGLAEPLVESTERVRANRRPVIATAVAMLGVDVALLAIPFVVLLGYLPARASTAQLETTLLLLRIVAIGLPLVSPLFACMLAALATGSPSAPAPRASR